ncbi:MAG: acyltransferase [Pirellulales bacterium]
MLVTPQLDQPQRQFADGPALSGRIPALDGVRGLAILLVTLYRFNIGPDYYGGFGGALFGALKFGYLGVDLFFVLSGFLITGILYDAKQESRYFHNFYARRALRIFPLYYGFLFVMLVALPAMLGSRWDLFAEARADQAWLWLYAANFLMGIRGAWCLGSFEHFWSLAIEEHFYLVWPLVIFWCSRRLAIVASLVALCVSIFGRIVWLRMGGNDVAVELFTFFRLDGLALGALAALWARGPRGIAPVARWALVAAVVCGLMLIAITPGERRLLGLRWTIVAGFFAGVLVLAVASRPATWWGTFWRSPVLAFFGKYSYAMYVFQLPLVALMAPLITAEGMCSELGSVFWGRVAYIGIMSAVTTGCAVASWHLFEKRLLRLKTRFA